MIAADPVACTLEVTEQPERLREWRALADLVEAREVLVDGIRLTLPPSADLGELTRLCRAEQQCCGFFRFALTMDARGTALEVRAPTEALRLLHAMFGTAP